MKKKVVLAVGAHPDDIDFGAGGTIARWAAEGAYVYYLIYTDGSKVFWPNERRKIREEPYGYKNYLKIR